ncbi:MAG: right-handed parallel beta-helix repeat-containing protein [Candidatus Eisenbacteria sp.]|nr:right-handed parallel beta-helix repeat-containing protein [Candidatus Eisenbacteria bacterium]
MGVGNRDLDYLGKNMVVRSHDGDPTACIIDCESAGRGFYFHWGEDATSTLEGITITNGLAQPAGAIFLESQSSPLINNCLFSNNTAGLHGGAISMLYSDPSFSNCTFVGNSAGTSGGAIQITSNSSPSFVECTIADNGAPDGGGVHTWGSNPVFENVIIAFSSEGEAVFTGGAGTPTLACCDIYGNAGGDWTSGIEGQFGTDGNISENPIFCDAANGDFRLRDDSPCGPVSNPVCGVIGAHGVGCSSFMIESAVDVPGDQGGQMRLRWSNETHDRADADTVVTHYSVWRRVEELPRGGGSLGSESHLSQLRFPPGEWDFVLTVPAYGEESYGAICPTLCDSTIASGQCWSVFFVRAGTAIPTVYYDTVPDSGYSVDNLAPSPPGSLRFESPTLLVWDESEDEDFNYFTVYGSAIGFLDETAEVVDYTSDTSMDIAGYGYAYYHVTATDFSGNQGAGAGVAGPSGISEQPPTRCFALYQCRPNPGRAGTFFSFDLPVEVDVRLRVFDAAGRVVITLVEDRLAAGSYSMPWTGATASGEQVDTGVYFYRLEAGRFVQTRKLLVAN